ncbi:MAG: hypothetical protein SVZ03_06675 [Spirochaetota bacterium]|nr:hypothetical protein [Spirochaetota bacterium]
MGKFSRNRRKIPQGINPLPHVPNGYPQGDKPHPLCTYGYPPGDKPHPLCNYGYPSGDKPLPLCADCSLSMIIDVVNSDYNGIGAKGWLDISRLISEPENL